MVRKWWQRTGEIEGKKKGWIWSKHILHIMKFSNNKKNMAY